MEVKTQKALFDAVEKQLTDRKLHTARQPGSPSAQIGDTLQAIIPVSDKGQPALMELMIGPIDGNVSILQLYTTVLTDAGTDRRELEKALDGLNFNCPIGAFGFYENQFYHRMTVPIFEDPVIVQANRIIFTIGAIGSIISVFYDRIIELVSGKLTAEQFLQSLPSASA